MSDQPPYPPGPNGPQGAQPPRGPFPGQQGPYGPGSQGPQQQGPQQHGPQQQGPYSGPPAMRPPQQGGGPGYGPQPGQGPQGQPPGQYGPQGPQPGYPQGPGYGPQGFGQQGPPQGPPPQGPDYLSGPTPPPRRRRGILITAGVVIAALAVSGGAYAVVSSGGGDNADAAIHELPSTSVAAAWVTLHPGGDKEKAALHTMHQLDAKIPASGSLRDGILDQIVKSDTSDVDAKSVKPWLGDHLAIAAVPQDGRLKPIAAVEVTDEDKAKAFLDKRNSENSEQTAYAFDGDYVVIGTSQDSVKKAISAADSDDLGGNAAYSSAIKSLSLSPMGAAWADTKALTPYAEKAGQDVPSWTPSSAVVGFTFQDTYMDAQIKIQGGPKFSADKMGARIGKLPGDTTMAIGATGLDKGVGQLADLLENSPAGGLAMMPLTSLSYKTGIESREQLATLLGSRTILATGPGLSTVGLISKSDDPEKTKAELDDLASRLANGRDFATKQTEEGTVFATSSGYADKLAAQDGDLGEQSNYKTAVPDAAEANVVMYANLDSIADVGGSDMPSQLTKYESFGLTCSFSADGATDVRMRLVTK